jgi:hypothetical protein
MVREKCGILFIVYSMQIVNPYFVYIWSHVSLFQLLLIVDEQSIPYVGRVHDYALFSYPPCTLEGKKCLKEKRKSYRNSSVHAIGMVWTETTPTALNLCIHASQLIEISSLNPLGSPFFPRRPSSVALSKLNSNAPLFRTCLLAAAATAAECWP